MAVVELGVGGFKYKVSCADGQEESLRRLALMLDAKVEQVKKAGAVPESLGLLMGALLLANELEEKSQAAHREKNDTAISADALAQTVQLIEKASEKISTVAETIENA